MDQKLKEAQIFLSQRYELYKRLEAERNAALKYKELQLKLRILNGSYLFSKRLELSKEFEKLMEKLKKKTEDILFQTS